MNYADEHVDTQLRRVRAEAAHVDRLGEVYRQWAAAADIVVTARDQLRDFTHSLVTNVWTDEAGADFKARVDKSVTVLNTWCDSFDTQFHRFSTLLHTLGLDYPQIVRNVTIIRDNCVRQATADLNSGKTPDDRPFQEEAAAQLARLDSYYWSAYWIQLGLASGPNWGEPRAALTGPDTPSAPASAPSAASPSAASPSAAAPAAAPQEAPVEAPAPVDPGQPQETQPQTGDPLAAAASALQAAQGLLDGAGTQVPPVLSAPGFEFGDVPRPAAYDYGGEPGLAGLGGVPAAASSGIGGIGGAATVGGAAAFGPGAGTLPGPGTAPLPSAGLTGAAASTAAAGVPRSSPPMMPPQSGAGAAAAKPANRIRPGDADRPATEPRPRRRARNAPVTPGVALAGRAGASQPTPSARRGWDSENDSLRVLDEHLWQVNPSEEETHEQDRRRPGRDGHDRPAAHRAPDAGLVGPGGAAHQSPRPR